MNGKPINKLKEYDVVEVAPINKPIGLNGYSPIEKIISNLSENLPKLEDRKISTATLCTKGSKVKNAIETIEPSGDWTGQHATIELKYYVKHFEAIKKLNDFNIIHNHTVEFPEYLINNKIEKPIVNTVHIPYDIYERVDHLQIPNCYYVAISKSHKKELEKKGIEVDKVIYHGLNMDDIPYQDKKENYILAMSRITQDKGVHIAIEAAKKANQKLVIAGPIQGKPQDKEYYKEKIEPYIELKLAFDKNPEKAMQEIINTDKKVIYCGEVSDKKFDLYGKAKAFLFPIQWEEPFGLVMLESLACGTPVLASNRGSVPEIIENQKTGFIYNNGSDSFAYGLTLVDLLKPEDCRKRAEQFSTKKMVKNYANFFEEVMANYHA